MRSRKRAVRSVVIGRMATWSVVFAELAAFTEACHLPIAGVESVLVFEVGCRRFLGIATWEARVDFLVEGATEGFAYALSRVLMPIASQLCLTSLKY